MRSWLRSNGSRSIPAPRSKRMKKHASGVFDTAQLESRAASKRSALEPTLPVGIQSGFGKSPRCRPAMTVRVFVKRNYHVTYFTHFEVHHVVISRIINSGPVASER